MSGKLLNPRLTRPDGLLAGLSWRRIVLIRRLVAALLVLVAVVLALPTRAASGTHPVLVAARDLAPGSTLTDADVAVRQWPGDLIPATAFNSAEQVTGRVLAGAASSGEPLTLLRLAGPELARRASGRADTTSVPIRLADAEVAGLLGPGRQVDVITVDERSDRPTVLATDAIVLTVLPAPSKLADGHGRLVLVAVPGSVAAKLAAATLNQEVTVMLR